MSKYTDDFELDRVKLERANAAFGQLLSAAIIAGHERDYAIDVTSSSERPQFIPAPVMLPPDGPPPERRQFANIVSTERRREFATNLWNRKRRHRPPIGRFTVLDLRPIGKHRVNDCRWSDGKFFCGAATAPGESWCAEHAKRVFREPKAR